MAVGSILYQFLIMPLEIILEFIYGIAFNLSDSVPFAIFAMSFTMNILLLPLYNRADEIQAEESSAENRLNDGVRHIKKTFSGDERYMMLQTYYRQNNYKPYYSLRGSLPLVLEIPFFIAAYRFLSGMSELNGCTFGPITDLGSPDALIRTGSFTLNLLPVLMTLINIISSSIYMKDYSLKDKLKLYGMAMVFLVLLYDSPAGLVFYWTLNNLFSLIKNLFNKLQEPGKALKAVMSLLGSITLVYGLLFYRTTSWKHQLMVIVFGALMTMPLILTLVHNKDIQIAGSHDYRLFLRGGSFLTVLTGLLIPSAVISSSPGEFVKLTDLHLPTLHILNASLCAAGTFIIWLGVFYYLASPKVRIASEFCISALSIAAVIDYMFFGANLGTLTKDLAFENDMLVTSGDTFSLITSKEKLLNTAVLTTVLAITAFVFLKWRTGLKSILSILIIAAIIPAAINISTIVKEAPVIEAAALEIEKSSSIDLRLSRSNRNIVVIMLDRAIGGYIPFLFQERPELKSQFAGFTYYPNTVSFGSSTNTGFPALMGGYEYTPERINSRSDESLESKHNEALKVMPVLFSEAGYDVTICDPTYAGYSWIPDLSIYDLYPEFNVYNTEQGQFSIQPDDLLSEKLDNLWKRNFFCYSIMKCSPIVLQSFLYQDGTYYFRDMYSSQNIADISHAKGLNSTFMNSFSVLCALPDITNITEGDGSFLFLSNQTTHSPALLQEPEYYPADVVDNADYDSSHSSRFEAGGKTLTMETKSQMTHYHVNMAALIQIGNWLDYLRDAGVYDNTRIIIVSDHGRELYQFSDLLAASRDPVMLFNSLFMVKDFDSDDFSVDYELMTNADVPILAMDGIVAGPINPFTGNLISNEGEKDGSLKLFAVKGGDWDTKVNNGNVFLPGYWFSLHDSIFDLENWEALGEW